MSEETKPEPYGKCVTHHACDCIMEENRRLRESLEVCHSALVDIVDVPHEAPSGAEERKIARRALRRSALKCSVCHQPNPKHKMDCPNGQKGK